MKAVFVACVLVCLGLLIGCGSSGTGVVPGGTDTTGGTGGTTGNSAPPVVSPVSGMDGNISWDGEKLVVRINWPGSTRLIGNETRSIDVAVTGPGIPSGNPDEVNSGTITWPHTEIVLLVPAGNDRFIQFKEYTSALSEVKTSYIRLGSLSPANPRLGLNFFLADEYWGQNNVVGGAVGLTLGTAGIPVKTLLQVIDTDNELDLTDDDADGTLDQPDQDDEDWYYFDCTAALTFVTVRVSNIEGGIDGLTNMTPTLIVTYDGDAANPIDCDNATPANSDPNGARFINGTPTEAAPDTGSAIGDGTTDITVSGELPRGRYFVQVDDNGADTAFGYQISATGDVLVPVGGGGN